MKPVAWVPRLVVGDDEQPRTKPKKAATTATTTTTTTTSEPKAEPLRLQDFLKREQLVHSGGEAKHAIQEGKVTINGVVDTARKRQLKRGDVVAYGGKSAVVVDVDSGA